MIRRIVIGLVTISLALVACGEETSDPGTAQGCDRSNPPLFKDGVLTVGTDRPAYPPWFEGSPKAYSGFEGDLATEVADRMELPIKWVIEPFNKSYAPGAKSYDFDVNQISITPEREQVVDFGDGYFDNNQGILVLDESSPVADAASLSDLKDSQLGAQVGTTSLAFINSTIEPSSDPKVYDTTNDVKSALDSGQIDALVTDLVTTVFLRDIEFGKGEVIGQYPTNEQFGMLFEKGNPLRNCVNDVLAEIREDGTLERLQEKWLKDYLSVPTLED